MSLTEHARFQDVVNWMVDRTFSIDTVTLAAAQGDLQIGTVLTNDASAVKITSAATAAKAAYVLVEPAANAVGTQAVHVLKFGPATVVESGLKFTTTEAAEITAAKAALFTLSRIRVVDEADFRTL